MSTPNIIQGVVLFAQLISICYAVHMIRKAAARTKAVDERIKHHDRVIADVVHKELFHIYSNVN